MKKFHLLSFSGNHYPTVVPDRYTLSRSDSGVYYDSYEYEDNYEVVIIWNQKDMINIYCMEKDLYYFLFSKSSATLRATYSPESNIPPKIGPIRCDP